MALTEQIWASVCMAPGRLGHQVTALYFIVPNVPRTELSMGQFSDVSGTGIAGRILLWEQILNPMEQENFWMGPLEWKQL